GFALERLGQVYTRLDESHYRYESGGGRFVRDLAVDADGLVREYPDFWVLVSSTGTPEAAG
ncbi:MAG TPA: putative glycolipid-binding domain-containing protein, partial [Thermoanaerobaculia bacterium]